jgi:hypothetical protein
MTGPGRFVTVLTCAVLLLAGASAAAAAETQTRADATKDVLRVRFADGQVTHLRADRAHDVVRARAVHRGNALRLVVEVRRLARHDYIASWYVRTPKRTWWVHYDKEQGAPYTSLFHAGGPEVLDCDGLRGTSSRRSDRVTVRVPRSCIGNPRWIRFGSSVGHETNDHVVLDDGGLDAGFYANKCRLGPRVRHG